MDWDYPRKDSKNIENLRNNVVIATRGYHGKNLLTRSVAIKDSSPIAIRRDVKNLYV